MKSSRPVQNVATALLAASAFGFAACGSPTETVSASGAAIVTDGSVGNDAPVLESDAGADVTATQDAGSGADSAADAASSCFATKLGAEGECITTAACAALGNHVSSPGYCEGPDDIQCCTPVAAPVDASTPIVDSGAPDTAPPPSLFVGTYACTAVTTVNLTSPPFGNYPQPNQTANATVVQKGATLDATVVASGGGGTCSLVFTSSGKIDPGQSCTVDGTAIASFTSSSETLNGQALTVALAFNLGGTMDGFSLAGTGTETLSCTRQ